MAVKTKIATHVAPAVAAPKSFVRRAVPANFSTRIFANSKINRAPMKVNSTTVSSALQSTVFLRRAVTESAINWHPIPIQPARNKGRSVLSAESSKGSVFPVVRQPKAAGQTILVVCHGEAPIKAACASPPFLRIKSATPVIRNGSLTVSKVPSALISKETAMAFVPKRVVHSQTPQTTAIPIVPMGTASDLVKTSAYAKRTTNFSKAIGDVPHNRRHVMKTRLRVTKQAKAATVVNVCVGSIAVTPIVLRGFASNLIPNKTSVFARAKSVEQLKPVPSYFRPSRDHPLRHVRIRHYLVLVAQNPFQKIMEAVLRRD